MGLRLGLSGRMGGVPPWPQTLAALFAPFQGAGQFDLGLDRCALIGGALGFELARIGRLIAYWRSARSQRL